jgi:hypothetical protein
MLCCAEVKIHHRVTEDTEMELNKAVLCVLCDSVVSRRSPDVKSRVKDD